MTGLIVSMAGLGVLIVVQTGAMFFWGGKLTARVQYHGEMHDRHETRLDGLDGRVNQLDRREGPR